MATRWVQEGYWGRYFLRLSEDGHFQFQIPRGGGVWRVIQLDLTPDDGGTFGLTSYSAYDVAGQAGAGQPTGTAGHAPASQARPAPRVPGAPPNARLVDILRSVNDRSQPGDPPARTDTNPDEP